MTYAKNAKKPYKMKHGHLLLKLRNNKQISMIGNNNPKKEIKLKAQAIQKPQSKCINKSIRFNTVNNNNFFIISVKLMNNERSICLCLASLLVRLNIFPSRYNFVEFMDCCID